MSSQRKEPRKVSPERLYQVTSRYFCAGMISSNGIITRAAPILRRHVLGKNTLKAMDTCKDNGWQVSRIINGKAYPR